MSLLQMWPTGNESGYKLLQIHNVKTIIANGLGVRRADDAMGAAHCSSNIYIIGQK